METCNAKRYPRCTYEFRAAVVGWVTSLFVHAVLLACVLYATLPSWLAMRNRSGNAISQQQRHTAVLVTGIDPEELLELPPGVDESSIDIPRFINDNMERFSNLSTDTAFAVLGTLGKRLEQEDPEILDRMLRQVNTAFGVTNTAPSRKNTPAFEEITVDQIRRYALPSGTDAIEVVLRDPVHNTVVSVTHSGEEITGDLRTGARLFALMEDIPVLRKVYDQCVARILPKLLRE